MAPNFKTRESLPPGSLGYAGRRARCADGPPNDKDIRLAFRPKLLFKMGSLFYRYGACFAISGISILLYCIYDAVISIFKMMSMWVCTGYALTFFTVAYMKDGELSVWFQRLSIWQTLLNSVLDGFGVDAEMRLDDKKQYIFGSFPHGATTTQHLLTMTDSCGFFEKVYAGPKRDLAATVLFLLPGLRELISLLGNVDASSKTAHHNLKKGRSLQIFVGGEKEQLMTKPGEHKIFLKSRKGFIKLALQYGCDLVPTYAFGENELYRISDFGLPFRQFLQEKFQVAFCLSFGSPRWWNWLAPLKGSKLYIAVGKPITVDKKAKHEITTEDIESLHDTFCKEIQRLFESKKGKYGVAADVKLRIV